MIEVKNAVKNFDDIVAVNDVSVDIREGSIFGLVGTNGAGKSTLLRMLCGILKADKGSISVDGEDVFENPSIKENIYYISDDQYYIKNYTPKDIMKYTASFYPNFDKERYNYLINTFGLPYIRKINNFSKGMKKQLSVILGVCANTKYILCDETFDGLDPVMRQAVKSLFANDMQKRGLVPVIASHNLRELEDICDRVGLVYKGGILFARDLDDMKLNMHKVQCVLPEGFDLAKLRELLDVVTLETRGKLITFTARGSREETEQKIASFEPVFYELIPLTLEEIFISETGVRGYDIGKIIL